MKLIIILCGLGLEPFVTKLSEFREMRWFGVYSAWVEEKISGSPVPYDNALGVILVLAPPLLLVILIGYGLNTYLGVLSLPLYYLFALAILLYSMGPVFLGRVLHLLESALDDEDEAQIGHYLGKLVQPGTTPPAAHDEREIINRIFVGANESLFAVILWFFILGPLGALLYRLASILSARHQEKNGYADAARRLCDILDWLALRVFALGLALAGNMTKAYAAWKTGDTLKLGNGDALLTSIAHGALDYPPEQQTGDHRRSYWIEATRRLLSVTLIIWLVLLALMVIASVLL